MFSIVKNIWVSPCFGLNSDFRSRFCVQVQCSASRGSPVFPFDSVTRNCFSSAKEKEKTESLVDIGNGQPGYCVGQNDRVGSLMDVEKTESLVDIGNGQPGYCVGQNDRVGSLMDVEKGNLGSKKKTDKTAIPEKLEPLWNDGYGTQTVKDYLDLAKEIIKPDGGPPRWFCPVDCGRPLKDSPLLLFLPGIDGLGLGLILHHKALGKAFEVWCLHIPVYDRTPFEELVKFVESTLRIEHASRPNKPIYLVGDSFGGCLALAVAARNPTIDLVVIVANPATSFSRSQLQPLFPLIEALPAELHLTVPYLLSVVMGNPVKMAMVNVKNTIPPSQVLEQLSGNLTALLPRLYGLTDIIPKETLLWKLKMLKSAACYANSRLHAVSAEVLVLASGNDNILPSGDEAERLSGALQNCEIRYFKDNGHTILLEDDVNLLTVIKGTCKYRRSKRHDFVLDFLPPSMSEFKNAVDGNGWFHLFTSPVMFSTLEDGKIIRGLRGVPNEGPVLLVGYHMLMGLELVPLVEQFLREKNILVRGVAHPALFTEQVKPESREFSFDSLKIFGAVPVSASNLFKLFASKSHVLLYPGGAREALHPKGETYKLRWPDQPEFVRMAVKFGATIVPFGVIGEDDVAELVLDYDDQMKIPVLGDYIRRKNEESIQLRTGMGGEALYLPGLLPKIPGRFYYLFGKPIQTRGRKELLKDKQKANELYLKVKSEVENHIAFLMKKREQDPYRSIVDRTVYQTMYVPIDHIPTFEV